MYACSTLVHLKVKTPLVCERVLLYAHHGTSTSNPHQQTRVTLINKHE